MISSSLIDSKCIGLDKFVKLTFIGKDVVSYLNGQLTNNLERLEVGKVQLSCRLNLRGKVTAILHLCKLDQTTVEAYIAKSVAKQLKEEFEKYIIMEDVNIELEEAPIFIEEGFDVILQNKPIYFFNGIPSVISKPEQKIEQPTSSRLFYGIPQIDEELSSNKFLNESFLNEIAIDYKKGCFYGQETVSKINSGRGGATYSCLLEIDKPLPIKEETAFTINGEKAGTIIKSFSFDNNSFYYCYLKRRYRINKTNLEISIGNELQNVTVILFNKDFFDFTKISKDLFFTGAKLFNQENNIELAKKCFELAIKYDSENFDAFESLGVLLGREERYDEAISLMKTLADKSPDSVMAHTNLSLFYMKIGEIDAAEKEKAQATVLSMKAAAAEAKAKKSALEIEKQKKQELIKRKEMFLKVLDIDPNDALANYGLADIAFLEEKYETAKNYLMTVIDTDSKYSVAYLLLGKTLEKLNDIPQAKSIYENGIKVAADQGDMMPANEMQSRLTNLSSN